MSNTQENDPASRLIEHTAEKGDVYTIYKNGQLMKPDPNFNPINIRCSPEIDKEEESQEDIWRDLFRKYDSSTWYNASNEFTINRKP